MHHLCKRHLLKVESKRNLNKSNVFFFGLFFKPILYFILPTFLKEKQQLIYSLKKKSGLMRSFHPDLFEQKFRAGEVNSKAQLIEAVKPWLEESRKSALHLNREVFPGFALTLTSNRSQARTHTPAPGESAEGRNASACHV